MLLTTEAPEVIVLAGVFGLIIGSFLSMLSWRLPRFATASPTQQIINISFSRSLCPHCKQTLKWYQLIPLLSWFIFNRKCHHCNHPVSARYPIIEFTSMAISCFVISEFGFNEKGLTGLLLVYGLLLISIIDIEHQLILDKLSLPLIWLGLFINSFGIWATPSQAILGAIFGYLVLWAVFQGYRLTTGKEGMGYGDFKLLAVLGAWFGAMSLAQIILFAALISIAITIILKIYSKSFQWNQPVPFGPSLSLSGLVVLFFGNQVVMNTLSRLGV